MKHTYTRLMVVYLTLVAIALLSCRSVRKDIQRSTTDSTTRTEVAVSMQTGKDSITVKATTDSSTTHATSEYERETVIEDFAPTAISHASDIHVGTIRRTTIKEKGKAALSIIEVRSAKDSTRLIEHSNFDSTAASETIVTAEREDVHITRQVSAWNLIWILIAAGVIYWAYRRYTA